MPPEPSIAIIGASLTGLALALSLVRHSLYQPQSITIYEGRSSDIPHPANKSGVILTPNGLSILDSLGVLQRFADKCWLSEYRTYKNVHDETTRRVLIANETLYGYKNHRVWRRILLDTLLEVVRAEGVRVVWDAKFTSVLSETADTGVVFLVNGERQSASMLIGADGIWSSVRKHVVPGPDSDPTYTGTAGILSHIRWEEVSWPHEDYPRAFTLQDKPGALIVMPEDREGSVIMVALQTRMEAKTRAEWDALSRDTGFMRSVFTDKRDEWDSKTARMLIDAVSQDSNAPFLYLWPMSLMKRLPTWSSEAGRVIIMGDAAHALPPASGQGVNQALEDVSSFANLLVHLRANPSLDPKDALKFWHDLRQQRIDAVFDWMTNKTNVQRLPMEERERLVREGKVADPNSDENFDDMRWLYQPDTDQRLETWFREHETKDRKVLD